MAATLKLLVDSYDQLQPDRDGNISRDSETVTRAKGELFEATSKAESERLAEIGAALDPKEAQAQEAEDLRRRQAQLKAEQEALSDQLSNVEEQADRVESGKPAEDDGLGEQTVAELRVSAAAADVDPEGLKKPELIDAIRAKRSE